MGRGGTLDATGAGTAGARDGAVVAVLRLTTKPLLARPIERARVGHQLDGDVDAELDVSARQTVPMPPEASGAISR